MRVFGPIADQEQHSRATDQVGVPVQKGLAFIVQPVKVFDHQKQRAINSFGQEQACAASKVPDVRNFASMPARRSLSSAISSKACK